MRFEGVLPAFRAFEVVWQVRCGGGDFRARLAGELAALGSAAAESLEALGSAVAELAPDAAFVERERDVHAESCDMLPALSEGIESRRGVGHPSGARAVCETFCCRRNCVTTRLHLGSCGACMSQFPGLRRLTCAGTAKEATNY